MTSGIASCAARTRQSKREQRLNKMHSTVRVPPITFPNSIGPFTKLNMDDDIVPDLDPFALFDLPSHTTWIIPPGYIFQRSLDPPTSPLTLLPDNDNIECYSPTHNDVVPDSDPPYPAHIQMLLPYEPRGRTTTQSRRLNATVPGMGDDDEARETVAVQGGGDSLNNPQ
jgi:hypothetical protein